MADDNDIRKNPFYGYYKSKGLIVLGIPSNSFNQQFR
mgnify:CR=1 FL=1